MFNSDLCWVLIWRIELVFCAFLVDLRNGVLDFGAEIVWWLRKLRKLIENETLKMYCFNVV